MAICWKSNTSCDCRGPAQVSHQQRVITPEVLHVPLHEATAGARDPSDVKRILRCAMPICVLGNRGAPLTPGLGHCCRPAFRLSCLIFGLSCFMFQPQWRAARLACNRLIYDAGSGTWPSCASKGRGCSGTISRSASSTQRWAASSAFSDRTQIDTLAACALHRLVLCPSPLPLAAGGAAGRFDSA